MVAISSAYALISDDCMAQLEDGQTVKHVRRHGNALGNKPPTSAARLSIFMPI